MFLNFAPSARRTVAQPAVRKHGRYRGFRLSTLPSGVVVAKRPDLSLVGSEVGDVCNAVDEAVDNPPLPREILMTDLAALMAD
jgi:hypothetical protein